MTDRFLTKADLEMLTGLRQPAAQIRFLQRWNIAHVVARTGRPVVCWTAVEP